MADRANAPTGPADCRPAALLSPQSVLILVDGHPVRVTSFRPEVWASIPAARRPDTAVYLDGRIITFQVVD